ncbi:hypothetical protein DC498_14680 [Terrimonas sp.]|nr:hypothetical protein DC498_14680 [Terrimonas sp.]
MLLGVYVSCNPAGEKPKNETPEANKTNSSSIINCYKYESASDTVVLKLIRVGASVTGTLVYKLKEKDKNMGTIQGYMKENILVADYTFMSEGTQSIRQVAFKSDGDSFTEGYGDIVDENEKFRFKNLDSLTFNTSVKLSGYPCE